MSQRPKVFAVQEAQDKDFSPATVFGDITCLLPHGRRVTFAIQPVYAELGFKLAKYDPDQDSLLLTGDPIAIGLAMHLALKKSGYCYVLKWDNREYRYYRILVDARKTT